jgi:hypothetical protein
MWAWSVEKGVLVLLIIMNMSIYVLGNRIKRKKAMTYNTDDYMQLSVHVQVCETSTV